MSDLLKSKHAPTPEELAQEAELTPHKFFNLDQHTKKMQIMDILSQFQRQLEMVETHIDQEAFDDLYSRVTKAGRGFVLLKPPRDPYRRPTAIAESSLPYLTRLDKDIDKPTDPGKPIWTRGSGRLEKMQDQEVCTCYGCYFGEGCTRYRRVAGDEDPHLDPIRPRDRDFWRDKGGKIVMARLRGP